MLSQIILDPLGGRTRLWRVIWLYGLVANCCYSAIVAAFLPGTIIATRLIFLGALVLGLYEMAALWQCAYNSPSRSLAHIVRMAVAVSLISSPLFVYLLIADPSVLSG